ncbi:MAG: carbohydrate ABC transporter permease [Dermabacter sp.]|nr:carbohydrate ABC transporter permease [Dermabacter sp.]
MNTSSTAPAKRRRRSIQKPGFGAHALLIVMSVFAAFPLVFMVLTSIKPFGEIYTFPPAFFPRNPTTAQYDQLLTTTDFMWLVGNSLFVCLTATGITTILASTAGYALARSRFRGRILLLRGTLLAYIFPPVLIVVPLFTIFAAADLANSYTALIAAYVMLTFPYAVWMLTSYFAKIPKAIEEAATIDGCSPYRTFWTIAVPLVGPGIAAVTIFSFINTWSEFLFSLVIVGGGDKRTVSVGLQQFLSGDVAQWGLLMAGSVIALAPVIVLFLIFQRQIIGGLTSGAVKD